jgi:hypothetical protein
MYKVEGYEFETKEQARIARQEMERVRFFKSQTTMDNPDMVLQLYNKLVDKEVFVTPVGLAYLRELQDYLNMIPYIKREDILPIPVYNPEQVGMEPEEQERIERQRAQRRRKDKAKELRRLKRKKNWDYCRLFHISTFFAIVFALVVVGMFLITWLSTDNINIINYENEIINKYESWEQELEEREEKLNQREQELNMQEEQR